MLDITLGIAIVLFPLAFMAYFVNRLLAIRAANHRANVSHPEYHAHDNWHDHEDDTLNGD